jgi:hypothetical protein
MVMRYPVHIWYDDHHKEKSVDVLLPNLRFKNKNIFFIFKHPVKVKVNDKFEYKYEQILENLSLTGTFYCRDTKLNCRIYEEERDDGLKVNIKYIDNVEIHCGVIQKFARAVEAAILDIDILEDDSDIDSDFDDISYEDELLENHFDCYNENVNSYESADDYEENYNTYEEYYDDYPN